MPRPVRALFPGCLQLPGGELTLRALEKLDGCAVTYAGSLLEAKVRVTVAQAPLMSGASAVNDPIEVLERARRAPGAVAAQARGASIELVTADDGPHLCVVEPEHDAPTYAGRSVSPLEALAGLRPAAEALARMHGEQRFHGRLGPASVLAPALGDLVRVELGLVPLDPRFRAPEQVEPRLGAEGPRTDVFAFGALFFYLVHGAAPFAGSSASAQLSALLDRATRPTLHAAGPAVDGVLARMVAVDPDARFPDVGTAYAALAEAVSSFSETLAVRPLPRFSVAPIARQISRRAQPPPRIVAAACVALVGTAFAGEALLNRKPTAPHVASSHVTEEPAPTVAAAAPKPAVIAVAPSVEPAASSSTKAVAALLADMVALPDAASPAFLLDRTEVPVRAYAACVEAGACTTTRKRGMGYREDDPIRKEWLCNLHRPGRDAHPINCVSRGQAEAFCKWAGKRLPTNAEWTLAVGTTRFPWGDTGLRCNRVVFARYGKDQGGCRKEPVGTAEVDAHKQGAAPSGVVDLAGNVWEWVSTPSEHGFGLLRGGAWDGNEFVLGASGTLEQTVDNADVTLGVRCAKGP